MAEGTRTPLQIFGQGEATLQSNREGLVQARAREADAALALSDAKSTTASVSAALNSYGKEMMELIHGSITPDTDPGEYLQAVLNTFHSGDRVGDAIIEKMAPLREAMRGDSVPIAVVGSTTGEVRFGLSAGDMKVTRRRRNESGFDVAAGVRLSLPMRRTNGYDTGVLGYMSNSWTYDGNADNPMDIGVRQSLSELQVAGDEGSILSLKDKPVGMIDPRNDIWAHERDIRGETGIAPVIAYGEAAVAALLGVFYRKAQQHSELDAPTTNTILAAALSVDIAPQMFADISDDEVRTRLSTKFIERISEATVRTIATETNTRRAFWTADFWSIEASPQVMKFTGVTTDAVIRSIQQGIEKSIGIAGHIRVDDPVDVPSWIVRENKEYRLTEDEARQVVLDTMTSRYGLSIEPAQLRSDVIDQKLAAQLEQKRREKQIHDQVASGRS